MKSLLLLFSLSIFCFGQTKESDLSLTYKNALNNITLSSVSELERLVKLEDFNTVEANKAIAFYYYEKSGASHVVESYLDKVLLLNPNDLESRWVRVKCNMNTNSNLNDFEKATEDLIYITNNGGASAKVYANLGLVYQKIAKIWEMTPVEAKSTYQDDNSADVIKKQNLAKAVQSLKDSNIYYLKSVEINDTYKKKVDFEVKDNNLLIDRFSK